MIPFWLLMVPILYHGRVEHQPWRFFHHGQCVRVAALHNLKPSACLLTLPRPVVGLDGE